MFKPIFAAWIAGACLVTAQENNAVDLDARRESVETLKQHIGMRQKRLDEVVAEIRERGQKTDESVESLVKILSGVKDSQDSKRSISQLKAEAVGGLKKMIQVYKTERAKVLEQLRSDGEAPAEALSKDMDTIDKLVEKRANDIVELVKSMPGSEDVAKYETDSDYTYRNGVSYENSRVSEEWRQNRRDKVQTEKARREVQDALEKAIADLTSRSNGIAAGIKAGGLSDPEKELREEELARTNELLKQRKAQLTEVRLPSVTPADATSRNQADDLKELFDDARDDIATNFTKTLQLYHDAAAERKKVHVLQENLVAREKWLSDNGPAAKKPE